MSTTAQIAYNCVKYAFLFLVVLMLVSMLFGPFSPGLNDKMIASTGFLVLGILGANYKNRFDWLIVIALVFCWFGDYFGHVSFTLVAISFLIGHLFLISAYFVKGVEWRRCLYVLGPVFLAFVALLVGFHPFISKSHMYPLVLVYMFVISAMVVFAAGASSGSLGKYLIVGAVLFFISDIFVARNHFVGHHIINRFGVYPLYYSACVLFALSLWHANEHPE